MTPYGTIRTGISICNTNKLNNVNIDSCFRQFIDYWTPIKLIILIINPFVLLFVKKYQLDRNVCACDYCRCLWIQKRRESVAEELRAQVPNAMSRNSNDNKINKYLFMRIKF